MTLSAEFFAFIHSNSNSDTNSLRLKLHGRNLGFDLDFALLQIECRKKNKKKLAHFLSNEHTIFPTSVAAEQSTHEAVASFHAKLAGRNRMILDMTAGLGIDAMAMAEAGNEVTACEIESSKTDALIHNRQVRSLSTLKIINGDSVKWLHENDSHFNIIFIDPARRGADNSRVYNFHDCTPDLLDIQEELLKRCDSLMIKASPLLDISQTLKDIPSTYSVRAICVAGECKEILIEAKQGSTPSLCEAIDLNEDGCFRSVFSYTPDDSEKIVNYASAEDIKEGCFLYEPNSAIMKLAPWTQLTSRFPTLLKFAPSSHLFVSSDKYDQFPGRILKIEKVIDKKDRRTLKGTPVNVVTRNYPLSASDLRKQLNVKEGKDQFIYGTRLGKEPVLILADRQNLNPADNTI